MEIEGVVQNGVIVPAGECQLPNGTKVRITAEQESQVPSIWDKLRQLGREYEQLPCDLPTDYAINHDHYIHGTPKRS